MVSGLSPNGLNPNWPYVHIDSGHSPKENFCGIMSIVKTDIIPMRKRSYNQLGLCLFFK